MNSLLFVDKYRPKESKYVVGADYVTRELVKWLKAWKNKDTPRAFLLSGPPGIGKSLLVNLIVAENGIPNAIRFDALKKRTKAALKKVEEAFGTRKIDAYFTGKMQRSKPGAVIMDDLDSMLTSADQGGIPQIVAFIKITKVPIICICNDPNNRSMQTLKSKCQHIRMQRPTPDVITAHLIGICKAEKSKMSIGQMKLIATSSGGDVRQAVNELEFVLSGNGSPFISMAEGTNITTDRPLNPFDAASSLFKQFSLPGSKCTREAVPLLQMASRAVDSDQNLVPLMIHENYLRASQSSFYKFADTAEAISLGDIMEGCYRKVNTGMMLEVRPALAVALPCFVIGAKLSTRAEFPSFLSHTGEINRRCRTMAEIANSMSRGGIHHDTTELSTETVGFMQKILIQPMEAAGPPSKPSESSALAGMIAMGLKSMHLTRLDWDYLAEAGDFPSIRAISKRKLISPAGRAALTRAMEPKGKHPTKGKQPPKKRGRFAVPASSASSEEEDSETEKLKEEEDF